jgi:hypothetical protein
MGGADSKLHGRAAKQRDELAPFHCALRPVLATGTVAHTSMRQETAALRNFYPAYDRCGSIASHRYARNAPDVSAMPPLATKSSPRNEAAALPSSVMNSRRLIRSPRRRARVTDGGTVGGRHQGRSQATDQECAARRPEPARMRPCRQRHRLDRTGSYSTALYPVGTHLGQRVKAEGGSP